MAFLHSAVLDNGLSELTGATELHICRDIPGDRGSVFALSIGSGLVSVIANPFFLGSMGRQVLIPQLTNGLATATGIGTYWALIDRTKLLASNLLTVPISLTEDSRFFIDSISIGIPFPV